MNFDPTGNAPADRSRTAAGGGASDQAAGRGLDYSEHVAALLAAERVRGARDRRRRQLAYVWIPFGIVMALGLPILIWMLTRIR